MIARSESLTLDPLLEHLGLHQAAAMLPEWLDRAASQELSYAEVKATASGNPAVLTLAEADAELQQAARHESATVIDE